MVEELHLARNKAAIGYVSGLVVCYSLASEKAG